VPEFEPESAALSVAPDAALQLRILQDLAALTFARAPLADILQMVAEGVFRGVGCERVLVAVLTRDRAQLQGRVALGCGAEALCTRFIFSMEGDPDDVVDAAIDSAQACRIDAARLEHPGTERLLQVTGCDEAVLVPFGTPTRQIGVLYADRQGKPLDDEVWRAVQHFALQAGLAVTLSAADPAGAQAGF
jgi:transcriptional regulator with GAF, ATPase, and Fis domain